ncbi:MAG: M48 family metallopeptidase [Deltaproteobacteria bacterium]|nr:M48 family metallopeptidase [Deltaproteobacteria bacterium]
MATQLQLGDIAVDVRLKNIKNVHLSVYPPIGRVQISAPAHMSLDTIRVFVISKLDWIKQRQGKLRQQERETPREYLERESHYVWGKRYLLSVVERDQVPSVALLHSRMILSVRTGTDKTEKEAILARWYREQLKAVVPELIAQWEPILSVHVQRVFVQQMKTKWGGCNPRARTLRFNTELAKKPKECLAYIVLHEMAHLLEPTHNARFVALMDRFMPAWQLCRQKLNRLPVRHADWDY